MLYDKNNNLQIFCFRRKQAIKRFLYDLNFNFICPFFQSIFGQNDIYRRSRLSVGFAIPHHCFHRHLTDLTKKLLHSPAVVDLQFYIDTLSTVCKNSKPNTNVQIKIYPYNICT